MDCIFCKIVKGELPSYKVYEDRHTLAFLDISPVNYGHTLVIPKKHYVNMEEIPEKELCEVIKTVKKIGKAVKEGLGAKGYNIGVNNDPVAGQIIPHLHFHIMSRAEGDGLKLWPQGKYGDGEAEEAIRKIKNKI
ncbi:HIT family protein [Candidatus Falkowbacteria bacterium]|nr:HIT family protein [Candidatus Falkowbacteria bacterium]